MTRTTKITFTMAFAALSSAALFFLGAPIAAALATFFIVPATAFGLNKIFTRKKGTPVKETDNKSTVTTTIPDNSANTTNSNTPAQPVVNPETPPVEPATLPVAQASTTTTTTSAASTTSTTQASTTTTITATAATTPVKTPPAQTGTTTTSTASTTTAKPATTTAKPATTPAALTSTTTTTTSAASTTPAPVVSAPLAKPATAAPTPPVALTSATTTTTSTAATPPAVSQPPADPANTTEIDERSAQAQSRLKRVNVVPKQKEGNGVVDPKLAAILQKRHKESEGTAPPQIQAKQAKAPRSPLKAATDYAYSSFADKLKPFGGGKSRQPDDLGPFNNRLQKQQEEELATLAPPQTAPLPASLAETLALEAAVPEQPEKTYSELEKLKAVLQIIQTEKNASQETNTKYIINEQWKTNMLTTYRELAMNRKQDDDAAQYGMSSLRYQALDWFPVANYSDNPIAELTAEIAKLEEANSSTPKL